MELLASHAALLIDAICQSFPHAVGARLCTKEEILGEFGCFPSRAWLAPAMQALASQVVFMQKGLVSFLALAQQTCCLVSCMYKEMQTLDARSIVWLHA